MLASYVRLIAAAAQSLPTSYMQRVTRCLGYVALRDTNSLERLMVTGQWRKWELEADIPSDGRIRSRNKYGHRSAAHSTIQLTAADGDGCFDWLKITHDPQQWGDDWEERINNLYIALKSNWINDTCVITTELHEWRAGECGGRVYRKWSLVYGMRNYNMFVSSSNRISFEGTLDDSKLTKLRSSSLTLNRYHINIKEPTLWL